MSSFKEVLDRALQDDPEARAEWDRTQFARDVSLWVLRYRLDHDLTQAELATMLGWKQSVVARLESGEREPSLVTLHNLAVRLGTTATIDIRPECVSVRFGRTRKIKSRTGPRSSSSLRQRRGPRLQPA